MAAGFLVPFLSGGLIKAQEIRDEYDENAGNIVDAASAKYNALDILSVLKAVLSLILEFSSPNPSSIALRACLLKDAANPLS